MTARSRTSLRDLFIKALKPRQEQFVEDFMDSFTNKVDDSEYQYFAASLTADTVGDWRQYGDADGFYTQQCTVASDTKGEGTWETKQTIEP